ncbi:MAG: radical SAM protein [Rhodanobacter sp.]
MDILFIDNLLFEGDINNPKFDLQPHLGLMSLVGVAERLGHRAEILDPKREIALGRTSLSSRLTGDLLNSIQKKNFDIIGFTALGCNFPFVVNLAKRVRRSYPDKKIVLGGPHATILHQEVMGAFPWFDIIFRHEAEETFARYLQMQDHQNLHLISGVTYRTPEGEVKINHGKPIIQDLNVLPRHQYDAYDFRETPVDFMRIEAGRGCPFSCTFCSTATFFGREYRLRSPESIKQDMLFLNEKYGISAFRLNHDLFTVNKKKVAEICEVIKPLAFTWGCSARADCVDTPLLETMAEAGCDRIYLGVEAGSRRMQKITRKNLDLSLVPEVLETTERLKMRTVTSFIVGYPEETEDDFKETLKMAVDLHCREAGLNTSQIHVLTPEPGTDLMEKNADVLFSDPDPTGFNIPTLNEDEVELVEAHPSIFSNYLAFPSGLPRDLVKAAAKLFTLLAELRIREIKYILSRYDGMYAMATLFSEWAQKNYLAISLLNVGSLASFLRSTVGDGDPCVSIAKTRWAVIRLAQQDLEKSPSSSMEFRESLHEELVISSTCLLLGNTHKPGDLDWIVSPTEAAECLSSREPVDMVIYGHRANGVFEFQFIDVGVDGLRLLQIFEQPTSYDAYLSVMETREDEAIADWDQLVELVDAGILAFHTKSAVKEVTLQ